MNCPHCRPTLFLAFAHRAFSSEVGKKVSNAKRREVERYLERQANDQYSRRAREHDYRARSAFKLKQMDEKMKFIRPGQVAIDAGAAPGAWCQVLSELIFPEDDAFARQHRKSAADEHADGYILGVDLLPITPLPHVDLLCKADITKPATRAEIRRRLDGRRVDLLLSDMAPNPTGEPYVDHLRIMALCQSLFEFGTVPDPEPVLAPNGVFLCKIFDGSERKLFEEQLKAQFRKVCVLKPDASRDSSSETYLFASGFRGGRRSPASER